MVGRTSAPPAQAQPVGEREQQFGSTQEDMHLRSPNLCFWLACGGEVQQHRRGVITAKLCVVIRLFLSASVDEHHPATTLP